MVRLSEQQQMRLEACGVQETISVLLMEPVLPLRLRHHIGRLDWTHSG